jgi:hypothetical protein
MSFNIFSQGRDPPLFVGIHVRAFVMEGMRLIFVLSLIAPRYWVLKAIGTTSLCFHHFSGDLAGTTSFVAYSISLTLNSLGCVVLLFR